MLLGRSLISRGCQMAMNQAMRFSSVAEAFTKHQVVPDVIDVAPEKKVELVFDSGVEADLGNILTPRQVKNPPKVTWDSEEGQLYTLIKVDPDAPSRVEPNFREWHHWMIVNIPGNKLEDGETLSEYISSGPPPKSGLHRYVYLVYNQPGGKLSDPEHGHLISRSRKNRSRWSTRAFAAKHNLGEPVAGNFFQSEFDDYVPLLYETLRTTK